MSLFKSSKHTFLAPAEPAPEWCPPRCMCLRCPRWTKIPVLFVHPCQQTVWTKSLNRRGWLTESNQSVAHVGNWLVVLFLRHIICLLRRMVLYVDHRGLQADLKGGLGGRQPPHWNKKWTDFLLLEQWPDATWMVIRNMVCLRSHPI